MKTGKKLTYVDLLADETIHTGFEQALDACKMELGHSQPLYISGNEIFTEDEFTVTAPFDTRTIIGKFQNATSGQIKWTIESAVQGFNSWQKTEWRTRVRILQKTADLLEEKMFSLAAIVSYESGKNRYEAIAEVSEAIDIIRYYTTIYQDQNGYIIPLKPENDNSGSRSILRPYGVFAIISPFNFPIALLTGMSAAALLTGNSVIVKPASAAPYSALKLYKAYWEAGVPADVIHYLTGPGEIFGEEVVHNHGISGIAFTGSRTAGLWLQQTFTREQPYPKPVILEMGSKNPVIVTPRADLAAAIDGVIKGSFGYSGQKCSATSRVYLHASIADLFLSGLKARVESLTIGDPRKKETFIGPLIDVAAVERFRVAVDEARASGGSVITGGEVLTSEDYRHGYFVEPTVVIGLPASHPLYDKELFIPFLIADTYVALEEALQKANNTNYGLTAGIFSEDADEIAYFFENIHSGVVYANRRGGATTGAWPGSQSFGGWNASGSTGKGVGGPYYLLSFVREQSQTRIGGPLP